MRAKGVLFLILAFILFIPFSFAQGTTSYPQASGEDGNWNLDGRGKFGTIGDDFDTFVKSLTDPFNMPVIADLDNNSLLEMVIVDSDNIRVYQNKELNIIDTLDFGTAPDDISNILLFDIDADGQLEIIFADTKTGTDEIFIFNFTQSDGLQIQRQFEFPSATIVKHPMIACRAANECIVTVDNSFKIDTFVPFSHFYRAFSFDSNNLTSSAATIYTESNAASNSLTFCSPRIKNIPVVNVDGADDDDEYIIAMIDKDGSDSFATYRLFILDNLTIQNSGSVTSDSITFGDDCDGADGGSNLFTPPTVVDIRTDFDNFEIYIGTTIDDDEFKIQVFDQFASDRETFPEFLNADGVIISNVVTGNFFPETASKDVCVLGYCSQGCTVFDVELDLLCGTQTRGTGLPQSDEFRFDLTGLFNISASIKNQDAVVHSVQHINNPTDSNDMDELLNTYGIFITDFVGTNELLRLFQNPAGDSVFNSIDFELVSQDDMIAMTDTNIFYFDDRATREPPIITDIEYNPCILDNGIAQLNTTLQVIVDYQDQNDEAFGFDPVTVTIYTYFGTPDQDVQIFPNSSVSSTDGTGTISGLFTLNQTGSGKIIRVEAFDNFNPSDIDVDEQIFSVASSGLEFGDSSCSKDLVEEAAAAVDEFNLTSEAVANEGLTNFFGESSNTFKVVPVVIVLFLMLGWTIAVLTTKGGENSSMITMNKVVFMVIGNIFIFIIGVIAGAISFGILLTIVIISLVILGIWVRRMFTSESTV